MIKCTICLEEKDGVLFSNNARKANGKLSYCKPCAAEKNKAWCAANKNKRALYRKEYREENQKKIKHAKSLWDQENSQHRKDYRIANSEVYRYHSMKRFVKKKLSQPRWLSVEQLGQMQNFYWLARDLEVVSGDKYHVDHIVPLQGKTVCGLHVPWNLQILPSDLNLKKSNTFDKEGL